MGVDWDALTSSSVAMRARLYLRGSLVGGHLADPRRCVSSPRGSGLTGSPVRIRTGLTNPTPPSIFLSTSSVSAVRRLRAAGSGPAALFFAGRPG